MPRFKRLVQAFDPRKHWQSQWHPLGKALLTSHPAPSASASARNTAAPASVLPTVHRLRETRLLSVTEFSIVAIAGGQNSAPCRVVVFGRSYIRRLFFCAGVKLQFCKSHTLSFSLANANDVPHQSPGLDRPRSNPGTLCTNCAVEPNVVPHLSHRVSK
jgi:hypothetical protein